MNQFISKISDVISNNIELKDNTVLKAMLENVKHTGDNIKFLNELKSTLIDVNKYLNNSDLRAICESIDFKIDDEYKTNLDSFITKVSNEFDVTSLAESILSDISITEPTLKSYLSDLVSECKSGKYPTYLYLNSLVSALDEYSYHNIVKESIDKCKKYMSSNIDKLIVVDTINYMNVNSKYGVNESVNNTLKQCVYENQFNPDVISLKLGAFSNTESVSMMLESLRLVRSQNDPRFDLGNGSNDVSIHSYIGPVLQEGSDLTFYVDNSFIHISQSALDSSLISRTINESNKIKLYELDELMIFNTDRNYYNAVKSFESLGFKFTRDGLGSKLTKNTIDFKIDESNNINLFFNSNKIDDVINIKSSDALLFESKDTKTCLFNVLDSIDSIYKIDFVKFIVSESKGVSMVINLENDFYVYDYINESKTDIYKFDAFKLYEFVLNKYTYDISSSFSLEINDARSKINKLEEAKNGLFDSITQYKESISKIDESLKSDIKNDDKKLLLDLKETINIELSKVQNSYIDVCSMIDKFFVTKTDCISENMDMESDVKTEETTETTEQNTETDEQDVENIEEKKKMNAGLRAYLDKKNGKAKDEDDSKDESEDKDEIEKDATLNENVKSITITYDDDTTEVINAENNIDDLTKFVIPDWAVSYLVDNDKSGLTEEQISKLDIFKKDVVDELGNDNFILKTDDNVSLGVLKENDIDSEEAECVQLEIKYTKDDEDDTQSQDDKDETQSQDDKDETQEEYTQTDKI